METVLFIVVVVVGVGGWLVIHRAMRRQIRSEAPKDDKKKARR